MTNKELAPVVVIKKGVASAADKSRLHKAGYIVLESDDLDCLRITEPMVSIPVGSDVVFNCAMRALKDNGSAADKFGRFLADALFKKPQEQS